MFRGFSFLEGTIPKGCAIANTITISNEFCMNTLLIQGPMFCFLCTCYLLAYPCSATLKLLSLLRISFSWTYPNSTWNDSSRYLGLFRQEHITTYHNRHGLCHHVWYLSLGTLVFNPQSLLPAKQFSKKLKRKQAVAEGRLSHRVWMNVKD